MRLLYFSPVNAGSYAQRPHFMVRALLDWGIESVLWVNPYPCRLPRWEDLRRAGGCGEQGTPPDPRIHVLNVPALPVEPLPLGAWLNRRLLGRDAWRRIEQFASGGTVTSLPLNSSDRETPPHCNGGALAASKHRLRDDLLIGIGRPCALALAALRRLRPAASFYDAMDNFPEFHRGLSRRSMRRHEDAIAAEVDLVVASSTFLADKFIARRLRVEKVLNACEEKERGGERAETGRQCSDDSPGLPVSVFASPPSSAISAASAAGSIGRWSSDLPKRCRRRGSNWWGRARVAPPRRLPANVSLLPACDRSEAGNHFARFSAGLIPFRSNALTAGVDPIKYYDYRAAGLPVLSTRFGEMALRGSGDGVYFLDGAGGLAEAVAAALAHRSDPVEISRFRRNNNWTARFRRSDGLRSLLPTLRIRRAA